MEFHVNFIKCFRTIYLFRGHLEGEGLDSLLSLLDSLWKVLYLYLKEYFFVLLDVYSDDQTLTTVTSLDIFLVLRASENICLFTLPVTHYTISCVKQT